MRVWRSKTEISLVHRLVYHSTLGLRVIKKKKEGVGLVLGHEAGGALGAVEEQPLAVRRHTHRRLSKVNTMTF